MQSKSVNAKRDVKSIFLEAVELPVPQRAAFVSKTCAGDQTLETKVYELLGFFEKDCASILDTGQIRSAIQKDSGAARTLKADVLTHKTSENETVGRYMLLSIVVSDRWGTVYRAIQIHPTRRYVFLKVLRTNLNTTQPDSPLDWIDSIKPIVVHPSIASLLGGGVKSNYGSFLVMESVNGMPITHFSRQHELSIDQRLSLFVEICNGVSFLHGNDCVYRDLEPENVLVSGTKESFTPKIIDFGVAVRLYREDDQLRHATDNLGEHEISGYLAPEQIRLPHSKLHATCDIYSLGVLLYKLIVGAPPFTKQQLAPLEYAERLRFLCEVSPEPPSEKLSKSQIAHLCANSKISRSRLFARIRCDLDFVVLKCLHKDPDQRYQTVDALVNDIELFLKFHRTSVGSSTVACRIRRPIWRMLNK